MYGIGGLRYEEAWFDIVTKCPLPYLSDISRDPVCSQVIKEYVLRENLCYYRLF